MARPCKERFVATRLKVSTFKPLGVPVARCAIVLLSLDELEALRLADFDGDQQEQAAAKMNISRPTFGRIVERARWKMTDALLHGKALRIAGGAVTSARRDRVRCGRCRRAWDVPAPVAAAFRCPRCPSEKSKAHDPPA